ncbi:hypothetical protein [Streptomyces sp. NPDC017524]|uniref:hypothetical protein n=1 Tax=Streptomyces sp. NPDC017524 TaxID=3364999 RepID=UPI0037A31517
MNIAGFFEELWPPPFGTPVGSIKDNVAAHRHGDAKEIIQYLSSGHDLFSVMGSSEDVMGSGETVLGGDSIHSDGAWIWRGDLCFYLRKYHVRLPNTFLAHVREKQYSMSAGKEIELRKLAQKVQDDLTAGNNSPSKHTNQRPNGPY